MTLLNTAENWRDNVFWINETVNQYGTRNATIPKENSKSGATMERFYKRYIHSLVALSFTDEYQYMIERDEIPDILQESVNQDFIANIPYVLDSELDLLDLLKDVSSLKKRYGKDNIYNQIFHDNIFAVESKAVKFVLYFMISFYNLNDLFNDYIRIFKQRNKEKYELWEKTAYFNQTLAEIYREDFFFTMLLEVLNLLISSKGKFSVNDIVNIYEGYLEEELTTKDDFSYRYLYDLQYSNIKNDEYPKWFGTNIWEKKVYGEINLTSSKTTNQSVENFKIPNEITCLNPAERASALRLIIDLFVININYDEVSEDLKKDKDFRPSELIKETLNTQKKYSKDIAKHRLENMMFYQRENEFHASQHYTALFQSEWNENSSVSHYILNPRISQLVDDISKEAITDELDKLSIEFIRILT